MCHNPALDPAKLERRAARPSRFAPSSASYVVSLFRYASMISGASAALSAARTLGLECGTCLARGNDAAPVWQSSGSRVRPRPSRLRHRNSSSVRPRPSRLPGRWQRDGSRGINRSITYTEHLLAGAAGGGGASTTYLPAPAAVVLAATLAA